MICPSCNASNLEGAQFCTGCGATLPTYSAPEVSQPVPEAPPVPPTYAAPPAPTYQAPPNYAAPPSYNQAYTPYPVAPAAGGGSGSKDWAAIASLVLGIVSIPCCCLSVMYFWIGIFISLAAGILGVVFGVMGMKSNKKGMAIAGLVCGIFGLIFSLSAFIFQYLIYDLLWSLGYYYY